MPSQDEASLLISQRELAGDAVYGGRVSGNYRVGSVTVESDRYESVGSVLASQVKSSQVKRSEVRATQPCHVLEPRGQRRGGDHGVTVAELSLRSLLPIRRRGSGRLHVRPSIVSHTSAHQT